MIDGIEEYYQRLASAIEEAIEDEWASAELEAVFFQGKSRYTGEYCRSEDGAVRSFPVNMQTGRVFRELRKLFKDTGEPVWGGAVFNLSSTGEFGMNWNYDNCDENGDTIFDEEVERQKSLDRHDRVTEK